MKKKTVFFMFLICFTFVVFVKDVRSDIEFWQAFGVDLKPAKGLKLYLEKQLRYEEKFTNLESDISEIGIKYRLNKLLDFRVNYRFTSRKGEKRNRFDGNVQLRLKWKTFKISNRTRLQEEFIETLEDKYSELEFRNRLRVFFSLSKKILPFLGGEIFIGLGEDAEKQDKFRLTLGTDWKVKKRLTLRFFYHYQKDLVKDKSKLSHIFGLKFNYSF